MLKKTITYTDYNSVERTESFYFHLNEAELMDMQLGTAGGFTEYVDKIVQSKDVPELIKLFKDIIMKAYGVKDDDGRRFRKSAELSEAFSQTEAFSKLYMELILDDKKASEFINGIIPKELSVGNVTPMIPPTNN